MFFLRPLLFFFFFNDTATTEIYTLSLHDALPISTRRRRSSPSSWSTAPSAATSTGTRRAPPSSTRCAGRRQRCRSEEHTSELQSLRHLVCRLLLEKKKNPTNRCQCKTRAVQCLFQ